MRKKLRRLESANPAYAELFEIYEAEVGAATSELGRKRAEIAELEARLREIDAADGADGAPTPAAAAAPGKVKSWRRAHAVVEKENAALRLEVAEGAKKARLSEMRSRRHLGDISAASKQARLSEVQSRRYLGDI